MTKAEKIKKGDFVEIDFTARIKEGKVFDTTLESEAAKAGMLKEDNEKERRKYKPFRLCVGEEMLLHGLDSGLVDKELEKWYEIELTPEEAFGKRNAKLIKTFSLGSFVKKGMMPVPGEFVNVNDMVAKIMNVSGGRVVLDFNNPLADKTVVYKLKINKKLTDEKEKIDTMAGFYFVSYEIKEKQDKQASKKEFILVVKGKKIDSVDKRIKKVLPALEIDYEG